MSATPGQGPSSGFLMFLSSSFSSKQLEPPEPERSHKVSEASEPREEEGEGREWLPCLVERRSVDAQLGGEQQPSTLMMKGAQPEVLSRQEAAASTPPRSREATDLHVSSSSRPRHHIHPAPAPQRPHRSDLQLQVNFAFEFVIFLFLCPHNVFNVVILPLNLQELSVILHKLSRPFTVSLSGKSRNTNSMYYLIKS